MKKRFITLTLALCLTFGFVPTSVSATIIKKFEDGPVTIIKFEDAPTTGKDIYDTFMGDTNVTVSDEGATPLGSSKPFTLFEAAELFTWTSKDSGVSSAYFSDIENGKYSSNGTLFNKSGSTNFYEYYVRDSGRSDVSSSGLRPLSHACGVAFDPTGCGRRNYVAILGYFSGEMASGSKLISRTYVYIFNGDTKNLEKTYELDTGYMSWMDGSSSGKTLDNVDAANFFQITAGDYDGDGRDSLVVYNGCITSNGRSMYELKYDGAWQENAAKLSVTGSTPYFNPAYVSGNFSDAEAYRRLNVCLESGDVNGDGIDDLIVVSCTGGLKESEANGQKNKTCKTYLAVGFGKKGAGGVGELSVSSSTIYDKSTTGTMAAPGVSVGDIDGDGKNEIVVAGFLNYSTEKTPTTLQNGKVAFTFYKCNGTDLTQINGLQELSDVSPISKRDSLRTTEENLWQQFSVECVAFDGINTREYMFLNGYVYILNSDGEPEKVSVTTCKGTQLFGDVTTELKDITNPLTNKSGTYDIDEVFIISASVGNFTNNRSDNKKDNGEESIFLTVGYKVNDKKSSDSNNYFIGEIMIEKCALDTSDKGKLVSAWPTRSAQPNYRYTKEGVYIDPSLAYNANGFKGMSHIRVAVDIDYDSCVAVYKYKEAFYSDPTVIAFLQAAPYFNELGAGNSSTTYSYSETYESSESTGYDFQVGIGVSAEIESSAVKFEVEESVTTGISKEYTESLSTEYTTVFEANDKNQVILRRMLIYTYYYSVQNADGSFDDNPANYIAVTVPQNPSITALTIEQYNLYADYYNDMCADYKNSNAWTSESKTYFTTRLNKISDADIAKYHLNNEGNPYSYASSLTDYANGISMVKDNTWVGLSSAGGTISQQFATTTGNERTKCSSLGVSVNMKIMAGASFAGTGAYAGVTASMEYVASKTKTTSMLETTATGGTVQGISEDLSDYDFQWQLIGWKAESGNAVFNNDVLFVGYAVKNVSAPTQPVADLSAEYPTEEDGKLVLTWTSPEIADGRKQTDSFRIYQNGKQIATVSNSGAGKKHTYTVDVSQCEEASVEYYIVSATKITVGSTITELCSVPSNTAECILALTEAQVRKLIDKALSDLNTDIDGLKKAIEEKANVKDLAAAISALTDAYAAADELLKKDISSANEMIAELRTAVNDANETISSAVSSLRSELDSTRQELEAAVADGDKKSAEDLSKAISDLTQAYKSADEVINSDIAALKNAVDDLKNSANAAHATLKNAVDLVEGKLNEATAKLTQMISDGDKRDAEALANAVAQLTRAYMLADEVLQLDISSLKSETASLRSSVAASLGELQKGIDLLRTDLNAAIAKLEAAVADGDKKTADALAQEIDKLNGVYKASEALLRAETESLAGELDAIKALNAAQKAQLEYDEQKYKTVKIVAYTALGAAALGVVSNASFITAKIVRHKKHSS